MSNPVEKLSHGYLADYRKLTAGAPAGDKFVVECSKCRKPGVPHGRAVRHQVRFVRTNTGREVVDVMIACSGGDPRKAKEQCQQTGFAYCPKEYLV